MSDNETPTPLTDAELESYYEDELYFGEESTQYMADFARSLERQLAEANARADMQEELRRGMAHECRETSKDTERLDWLLKDAVVRFENTYHDRQAIDNAMKGGE
jgi:hypothetical protein